MIFEVANRGVSLTLAREEFPVLLSQYLLRHPDTRGIEALGKEIFSGETTTEKTEEFIKRVAYWGGPTGWRNCGKVLSNPKNILLAIFKKAADQLHAREYEDALETIDAVFGIGPTYASKYLRFFDPQNCVALDSKLFERLGWAPVDYSRWRQKCVEIALVLGWPAADVEAAIFELITEHGV